MSDKWKYDYQPIKCGRGHMSCKDWHVTNVADIQGVHFTRKQATAVAKLLRQMDKEETA